MQRYINQDANILKYVFDRTHVDVKNRRKLYTIRLISYVWVFGIGKEKILLREKLKLKTPFYALITPSVNSIS